MNNYNYIKTPNTHKTFISNGLYEFLKLDGRTNEHYLQLYIAVGLLNDEIGSENTTIDEVMAKVGKKKRRTQDLLNSLIKAGLVHKINNYYELIG